MNVRSTWLTVPVSREDVIFIMSHSNNSICEDVNPEGLS